MKEYNNKRNFDKTSEPVGKKSKNKNLNFVIQLHHARATHYDFRLEHNGVLLSWAVPKGLSLNPKIKRLAVHVEDHPVDYQHFEGIIPKGNYGAGSVQIYDKGKYIPLDDFDKGLKKGHLRFVLNGEKFQGAWDLVKTDEKNWLIIKSNDKFATDKQKKTKNPFLTCDVQLATLTNTIPKGKNWLFEIKYDGYRIIAYKQDNNIKLVSRNGKDYTKKFAGIANSLLKLDYTCFILDGEVVVFDKNGKSNFSLLHNSNSNNFHYVVFDILSLEGEDLRNQKLIDRKDKLEKLLVKAQTNIIFSSFIIGKGKECFSLAKQNDLEGIIAKNINSVYSSERNEDWLKIKCYHRQEFVICGYTTTDTNPQISAILVGYYKNNDLIFVGKVGTGFDDKTRQDLNKKFKTLITNKSPFKTDPKIKNVTYLKPLLIAEIKYIELTKDNLLRQPSFVGLRTDKNPKEIILEVDNEN